MPNFQKCQTHGILYNTATFQQFSWADAILVAYMLHLKNGKHQDYVAILEIRNTTDKREAQSTIQWCIKINERKSARVNFEKLIRGI